MALEDGLVVNLPLKSNGLDVSGSGLDLTTISGASFVDGFLGFDGINDYAVRNLETIHKTASLTLTATIKLDDVTTSQSIVALAPRGQAAVARGVILQITSGVITAFQGDGSVFNTAATSSSLSIGETYDVTLTINDTTNELKIFLGGLPEDTTGSIGSTVWTDLAFDPNPAAFYVGARKTATAAGNQIADVRFTNGAIKRVKQWNRALTDIEVLEDYHESLRANNSFKTTDLVTRF